MKISILGTNGFLSTSIALYANKNGWQLNMYGLDKPLYHKCDNFYQIDLMKEYPDSAELFNSDIIVYAAGAGIQSNLHEALDIVYQMNVSVPVRLCNQLKRNKYNGIFVTFGSVFEMGETKEERAFSENDIIGSTCPAPTDYIVSKRMLSRFISSYKHDFAHWHFILPTIYGAGENPSRLIPYTINALRKGEHMSFTSGVQVRQYVHVSEVPRIIDLARQKRLPSGIYNIEGKETLTVKEIVNLIHRVMGVELSDNCFGSTDRTDVGMKYLALDGSLLRNIIDYKPVVSIEDAIPTY